MWLFMAGGAPMFVIVVFGLIAIAAAARFAYAPGPGRVGHIVALCISVAFASVVGTAVDIVAVSIFVPANEEWAHSPDLALILLTGLGESMSPIILGFSTVSIAALLTAVGLRRSPIPA